MPNVKRDPYKTLLTALLLQVWGHNLKRNNTIIQYSQELMCNVDMLEKKDLK